ncbi:hypothetical protein SCHPADRAFT_886156 [Schizopora paradoxa]|uniref:Uncharacterized protein n=1 Tax=Schizopora paradoxa TaxID=27342 RepID=A0A0H2S9T3_9AGAM|nr:hypothetical protein SCHPADRAFT_886156 [Schizopora paradoxa]
MTRLRWQERESEEDEEARDTDFRTAIDATIRTLATTCFQEETVIRCWVCEGGVFGTFVWRRRAEGASGRSAYLVDSKDGVVLLHEGGSQHHQTFGDVGEELGVLTGKRVYYANNGDERLTVGNGTLNQRREAANNASARQLSVRPVNAWSRRGSREMTTVMVTDGRKGMGWRSLLRRRAHPPHSLSTSAMNDDDHAATPAKHSRGEARRPCIRPPALDLYRVVGTSEQLRKKALNYNHMHDVSGIQVEHGPRRCIVSVPCDVLPSAHVHASSAPRPQAAPTPCRDVSMSRERSLVTRRTHARMLSSDQRRRDDELRCDTGRMARGWDGRGEMRGGEGEDSKAETAREVGAFRQRPSLASFDVNDSTLPRARQRALLSIIDDGCILPSASSTPAGA